VPAACQFHGLAVRQLPGIDLSDDVRIASLGYYSRAVPSAPCPICIRAGFSFPLNRIQERVRQMAHEIRRDCPDDLHFVCVLKGAFVFLADIVRHLKRAAVSRFHGPVELRARQPRRLARCDCSKTSTPRFDGRNVVIVEDIIDTGVTLNYSAWNPARAQSANRCARRVY